MKNGMGTSGYEDDENIPFGMCPNFKEEANECLNPESDSKHLFDINVLSVSDIEEELDLYLKYNY